MNYHWVDLKFYLTNFILKVLYSYRPRFTGELIYTVFRLYWLLFYRFLLLLCFWISKYFLKYSLWSSLSWMFSMISMRKFDSLDIILICLIWQKQFSTQSQDDWEEELVDSFEELSSIRRNWLSLDVSIGDWLDESDSILIRFIICLFIRFLMSRSTMIYLILQLGAICPFLPHLKHLMSFSSFFFRGKVFDIFYLNVFFVWVFYKRVFLLNLNISYLFFSF